MSDNAVRAVIVSGLIACFAVAIICATIARFAPQAKGGVSLVAPVTTCAAASRTESISVVISCDCTCSHRIEAGL